MKRRKYFKQTLTFLLSVLLATGVMNTAFAAKTELPAKAGETSSGAFEAEIGKVRVQVLSDTLVRVEVKGPNGYEDRPTYHVVNRDWPGPSEPATKEVGDEDTEIVTGNYIVNVPNGAESLSGVTVTDPEGKELWTYTSLPNAQQFLPAPGSTPDAWAIADNPRVVPATWGYSPMPEANTEFTDYNGWDSTNDAPDMYVFVPLGDARKLRQDFVDLTGRSELVPLKTLGLWQSRYWAYSEQEVYDTIKKYHEEGFPLDQFVVDTDWRVNGSTGYDINTKLFPDMHRFFEKAHDDYHVNIVFNDHPEPVNNQQALSQEDLNYRNANLRYLLNMGLDTWWFDRNWWTTIKSPFSGINKESFGMYLYQDITRSNSPKLRPLIMGNVDGIDNGHFNRAPNLASHRYSIQWTGDIGTKSQDLKQEIVNAVRSGAETLIPYVSADIGGHVTSVTPTMWTRWTQYAALSPIFRYHCTKGENNYREPWKFGSENEDIAREYIDMRYRLLPLFYLLSHQNYETGLPIVKRLDYNYPGYAQAQDNTEYLLGDGVLVAPIWTDGMTGAAVPASWLSHGDNSEQGLQAKFFNNTTLKGNPVLTRADKQIDFDWETKKPDEAVSADNFSASWEGKVTLGEDAKLAVTSDDGIRLYVDGKLVIDNWKASDSVTLTTDETYKADSIHDIKIEYYEGSGNAIVKFQYLPAAQKNDSRSVFIPDGRWIDVWSGKEYTGPQTVTVEHNLDTSPVFVRSGTIIPLIQQPKESTDQIDWGTVALDVYPSTRLEGTSELYEDDQKSVAYKDGQFRTTALETSFDRDTSEAVVNIGATKGTYDNAPDFSERTWKVRVHAPTSWGAVKSVKLNGQTTPSSTYAVDSAAAPFAFEGGALDSGIREIVFSKPLDEASEIRIQFESPQDEELPEYSDVPVETDISEKVLPGSVDLTAQGEDDWVHFGARGVDDVNRKKDNTSAIENIAVDGTKKAYDDGPVAFSWTDGDPMKTAENLQTGISLTDGGFGFDVHIGTEPKRIQLYLLSDDATGRLEVTDGTGSGAHTLDLSGSGRVVKKVVLTAQAESEGGKLHIAYRKTDGGGSVSLMAAAVSDFVPAEEAHITRSATLTPAPDTVDLSDEENLDWMHVGLNGDPTAINRKKDVTPMISAPQTSSACWKVDDYSSRIGWSDGSPVGSVPGSQNAISTGGSFQISVPSSSEWRKLKLYLGCWNSTSKIDVFGEDDDSGEATSLQYSAGSSKPGTAETRCLTVKYRSEKESNLYIRWSKVGGNGNISFAACTLSEIGSSDAPVEASLEEVQDSLNLSDERFAEWAHFGYQDGNAVNRKTGVIDPVIGDNKDLLGKDLLVSWDYKTAFSWKDGTPVQTVSKTQDLAHSFNGQELGLNLKPGDWRVSVYTSVWWASGQIEITDETGAVVDVLQYKSKTAASGSSEYRKLVLDYQGDKAQKLTVRIMPALAFDGHQGNMSLPAVTVEEAGKTELADAVEKAETDYSDSVEDTYTADSWEAFQTALAAAQDVLADDDATEEAIGGALDALDAAISDLELVQPEEPDKTALEDAVEKAGTDYPGSVEDTYTADSWEAFQTALAAAQRVIENPDANEEEVESTYNALKSAIKGLEEIPPETFDILSVQKFDSLSVLLGTKFSNLNLPEKAIVTLSNDSREELPVKWNKGDYDETKVGTYTLIGSLIVKSGIINPNEIQPSIKIYLKKHKDSNSKHDDNNENKPTKPTIPTVQTSTYTSDTNRDFSVNETYQFKITSKDGKVPTFVIGTPGVFEVESTIRNGNDYFIKLRAIGAPGDKAGIYINNGQRLLVATVGSNPNYVKFDTGKQLSVRAGKTYQFRVTAAKRPTFVCGTGSTFRVAFAGSKGNDYFFKVTATGKAGAKAGFYVNSEKVPRTIGTIIS